MMYWLASRRENLKWRVERGEIFGAEYEKKTEAAGGGSSGGDRQTNSLSVEEKVRTLIVERLKMNENVIGYWQDVSLSFLNS